MWSQLIDIMFLRLCFELSTLAMKTNVEDSSVESIDDDGLMIEEPQEAMADAEKISLLKKALLEERQRRVIEREKWSTFLMKIEVIQQQNKHKVRKIIQTYYQDAEIERYKQEIQEIQNDQGNTVIVAAPQLSDKEQKRSSISFSWKKNKKKEQEEQFNLQLAYEIFL